MEPINTCGVFPASDMSDVECHWGQALNRAVINTSTHEDGVIHELLQYVVRE